MKKKADLFLSTLTHQYRLVKWKKYGSAALKCWNVTLQKSFRSHRRSHHAVLKDAGRSVPNACPRTTTKKNVRKAEMPFFFENPSPPDTLQSICLWLRVKRYLLARNQNGIVHGHSVQGINESFVVMRTRTRRQIGSWHRRDEMQSGVTRISYVFCTYAAQLLPERGFSYRAFDEEMPKPLLFLPPLKIISPYQWYVVYFDFVSINW